MATTTKTKKKKLVYRQDPDGVFRLKKIDDNNSIKSVDLANKKKEVDNYLNELIDCSYSIVDDIPDKEIAQEEEKIINNNNPPQSYPEPEPQPQPQPTMKKVKPTTVNTSSKNLTIKPASTPPQPVVVVTEKIGEAKPEKKTSPPTPPTTPPQPPQEETKKKEQDTLITDIPSPTDFVTHEEIGEKKVEEVIIPAKPSIMSTFRELIRFHIPSFAFGIIATVIGTRYKDEIIYGAIGLTVLATGLAIVGILGLCLCLYLGLVKQSDLKVFSRYIDILKFRATEERPEEKVVVHEEIVAESESEPEHEHEHEQSEEVNMEEPQPEPQPEQYVAHDTEVIREIPIEPQPKLYQPKQKRASHPKVTPILIKDPHTQETGYQPLEEPQPPKPRRKSSTIRVTPYVYEPREPRKYSVIPTNNTIPLPGDSPTKTTTKHKLVHPKPLLQRIQTEPIKDLSRRNSKKSTGSESPTSTRSDPYYLLQNVPHHTKEKPHEIPPQVFKTKELPNLPHQAEELPFINEVRLVDAVSDDESDMIIPMEAPTSHYTAAIHDDNIYRNQSTKSRQSVLGTRANYRRFVSNVDNDYEY
ncbi:conserved hypothetical protein [Candida dubliniensis CD36]|uniref:Uncharacterized protein n=1 Tax=Candida dubliniensis (strain CD36 / ATCC MYA-646 / CBS 7987 / NCPF 3949 / NRRL Y-17841) TaxID=573826 RepID=B9WD73_CANDC|nr:conserved hypothetical protein [Candida dubliniensis CD36]CAX42623.1 conserved hypothetical protein [Candida dubliniensis CD36]